MLAKTLQFVYTRIKKKMESKHASQEAAICIHLYDTEINARFILPKLIIMCYLCFARLFLETKC